MTNIKNIIKPDAGAEQGIYVDGRSANGYVWLLINNKSVYIEIEASIDLEIIPSEYGAVYEIENITVDDVFAIDACVTLAGIDYTCHVPALTDDDTARIKQIIDDLIVSELDTMDCDDVINNYCDYA